MKTEKEIDERIKLITDRKSPGWFEELTGIYHACGLRDPEDLNPENMTQLQRDHYRKGYTFVTCDKPTPVPWRHYRSSRYS